MLCMCEKYSVLLQGRDGGYQSQNGERSYVDLREKSVCSQAEPPTKTETRFAIHHELGLNRKWGPLYKTALRLPLLTRSPMYSKNQMTRILRTCARIHPDMACTLALTVRLLGQLVEVQVLAYNLP